MIGQTISHYQILEKLGEGGMGVVYKAKDTKLDRFVALKFLPDRVNDDDAAKTRFFQEAKAAAGLNHPNICTIHGVEDSNQSLFIVMEFIDGQTLRKLVPYKKIDDALNAAVYIGEAIQEAHANGIVHRDIKADNIMISAKGQIKVMDFGLAKLKGAIKITRTSSTVGTLGYMAPEQIQGGDTDPRSDIFSMGVLLFEMLTGKLPFRGEHEAAMMYSILNEDPESIEAFIPDASPDLAHILNRALEKDQADRYQSMADMVSELRRLLKHSTRSHSVSFDSGSKPSTRSGSDRPSQTSTNPVSSPKTKVGLFSGLAATIILISAVAYFLLSKPVGIPFQNPKLTQISYSGIATEAAFSPDGRYIAYTEYADGKSSLWVRQMATSSTLQIIPPTTEGMRFLTFSPDGNFIYFRKNPEKSNPELHRIPVLGGQSVKILERPRSKISFSSDGKQFAFLRYDFSTGDHTIMLAQADGSNEKPLISRKGDYWFSGNPAWSPTKNLIVAALGTNEGGYRHKLIEIDIETGSEHVVSDYLWQNITDVLWKTDGTGLFLLGSEPGSINQQLFYVHYPNGKVQKITNDINDYTSASVTSNGQMAAVTKVEFNTTLQLAKDGKEQTLKRLTEQNRDGTNGIAIDLTQTIFYTSRVGNNVGLFQINHDGSAKKSLSSPNGEIFNISVTPDGQHLLYAFFSSQSTPSIWQLPIQGGPPKQITFNSEDSEPVMDLSGKWIIVSSWFTGTQNIMKVSLDGQQRIDLSKMTGVSPVLSPDGQTVYFIHADNKNPFAQLYSVSIDGGSARRHFNFPKDFIGGRTGIKWRPVHDQISFVREQNGVENIWVVNPDSTGLTQYSNFTADIIAEFSWMPNGSDVVMSRGKWSSDVVVIEDTEVPR